MFQVFRLLYTRLYTPALEISSNYRHLWMRLFGVWKHPVIATKGQERQGDGEGIV